MIDLEKIKEYIQTHKKSVPFCPFIPAYCDEHNYSNCATCKLLSWYGDDLDVK